MVSLPGLSNTQLLCTCSDSTESTVYCPSLSSGLARLLAMCRCNRARQQKGSCLRTRGQAARLRREGSGPWPSGQAAKRPSGQAKLGQTASEHPSEHPSASFAPSHGPLALSYWASRHHDAKLQAARGNSVCPSFSPCSLTCCRQRRARRETTCRCKL